MSELKYTPGPWEMNLGVDGAVVYHPDQGTIADIPMDLSAHPHNARLIAAAPELLEALEELERIVSGPISDALTGDALAEAGAYTALENAISAIAKAKGTL